MIKAYIITIKPTNSEKNIETKKNILERGFIPEFIEGIKGSELNTNEYFNYITKYYIKEKKIITPNEVACTLSHIKAMQRLIDSQNEYAIIFEDDVILNKLNSTVIKSACDLIKKKKFIIHLGGLEGLFHCVKNIHGTLVDSTLKLWEVAPIDYEKLVRAVGYVISKEAAIDYVQKINTNISLADDYAHLNELIKLDAVYFMNCISHPTLLKNSNIERERNFASKANSDLYWNKKIKERLVIFIKDLLDRNIERWNYKQVTKNMATIFK